MERSGVRGPVNLHHHLPQLRFFTGWFQKYNWGPLPFPCLEWHTKGMYVPTEEPLSLTGSSFPLPLPLCLSLSFHLSLFISLCPQLSPLHSLSSSSYHSPLPLSLYFCLPFFSLPLSRLSLSISSSPPPASLHLSPLTGFMSSHAGRTDVLYNESGMWRSAAGWGRGGVFLRGRGVVRVRVSPNPNPNPSSGGGAWLGLGLALTLTLTSSSGGGAWLGLGLGLGLALTLTLTLTLGAWGYVCHPYISSASVLC